MEKPSFAGVSVFDVPFTLDKIYSYEIPEDLKGLVHRGDIVTVPFGNGSRKRYAVVRELSDCCEYSAPLKSILSVQNPLFRLNDELLGLCGFLGLCHFYAISSFGFIGFHQSILQNYNR